MSPPPPRGRGAYEWLLMYTVLKIGYYLMFLI